MKIKCPYCETMFDDTLTNCPNCGAASTGVARTESKQPITIEQLKQWYQDRGLPPYETTRFFIGENHQGPRAFGIYQDESTGNFVVYKNNSSGERKVRYEGTDEAYAVNELYMRLKQEIIQQKQNAAAKKGGTAGGKAAAGTGKKSGGIKAFVKNHIKLIVILAIALLSVISFFHVVDGIPNEGYYRYNNTSYYHATVSTDNEDWYYYDDDTGTWEHTYDAVPEELTKNDTASDFYYTPTWDSTTQENDFDEVKPFEVSQYAEQYATEEPDATATGDNSWDNDDDDDTYTWDTDDTWDNDTTDWDTDW